MKTKVKQIKPHKTIPSIGLFFICILLFTGCNESALFTSEAGITAEVLPYKGKPTIHLNGDPVSPMMYALTDVPGGRWSWEELPRHNISQFCEQGFRLFQADLFFDHIWPEEDRFDLSIAEKQIKGILEVCPEAAIFLRLHVNAPKWWMEKYPEESVVYDSFPAGLDQQIGLSRLLEADPRRPFRNSLASVKWKTEISEKLRLFCKQLSKTTSGKSLAGIQIACGVYGEWHNWGILHDEGDLSEPMVVYFRQWLKNKYQTDQNLKMAWADSLATFESANVPTTKERAVTSAGIFRHPVKDRKVIDYYNCQHELIADDILHFGSVIKESWPRPIITGAFYGYFFSVFGREAYGAHLALHRVLKSDAIDYLSGPQVYYPENGYKPGEPYRSRSLVHSIWLHGKLWLDEYDQQPKRTWPYLGDKENLENYALNVKENISLIKRNSVFALLKGQGLWYYDFGVAAMHLHPKNEVNQQSGTSGYWDHPQYMDTIGQIKQWADGFLHEPYHSNADVLAVFDTESILYMKSTDDSKCPITEHIINWSSLALYYASVVFDAIHINDLEQIDLTPYKAIIFFNTFLVTSDQKKWIHEKVKQGGRHVVWMYAPGYTDGKELDKRFVSDLTGIQLNVFQSGKTPQINIKPGFSVVTSQTGKGPYDPVFYIDDPAVEVLGTYEENARPAFARKTLKNHISWYIGVPITSDDLFRKIFEQAGVTIYSAEKDIIYGGGDWLMLHTVWPGKRKIPLGGADSLTLDLPDLPTTRLFKISPKKETGFQE